MSKYGVNIEPIVTLFLALVFIKLRRQESRLLWKPLSAIKAHFDVTTNYDQLDSHTRMAMQEYMHQPSI